MRTKMGFARCTKVDYGVRTGERYDEISYRIKYFSVLPLIDRQRKGYATLSISDIIYLQDSLAFFIAPSLRYFISRSHTNFQRTCTSQPAIPKPQLLPNQAILRLRLVSIYRFFGVSLAYSYPPYPSAPPLLMLRFKEAYIHQRARLLLESYWRPNIVAKDTRISRLIAYRWERNIEIYSDTVIPRSLYILGRLYKLSPAIIEALLEYQR